MNGHSSSSRVVPCLFDRLIDDGEDALAAGGGRRDMTLEEYLETVKRDLEWLLNTRGFPSDWPWGRTPADPNPATKGHSREGQASCLADFPEAWNSVVAYGSVEPNLYGVMKGDTAPLRRAFEDAIARFEPRLDPRSLKVLDLGGDGAGSREFPSVRFEIQGRLRLLSRTELVRISTEIDMTTGMCHCQESAYGD